MGNQMSVPQRLEDQENELETDTHKVMPESECHQNGMLVVSQPHPVQQYDEVLEGEKSNIKGPADSSSVDSGTSVREDNAATASPTTMEISAVADASGKNLGKEAKPEAPAARSRFFLTLSRPVPGRAGDQATDSSTGSVKLDVSSNQAPRNKDPSEPGALPRAAAPGRDPDKTPGPTPAAQLGLSATWGPESGGAAPSKPKDPSFFDKLFKLDKEREQTPVDSQQEAKCAQHQDQARETPGSSTQSSNVPAEGDIADGRRREGQEITTVSCSVPGDPEELEPAKEDPQTENNNSIMSFFKTLVSPSKAETKKDPEDTASKAESVCDGQAGQKTAESQAKGAKKKHLHSPQLGLAFRKFFRHKGAEKSPTTPADIKPDKGHVTPQEPQGAAKNSTSTEAAKEGAKEKGGPTSLPLGKLFWKKSVKEDSVPTGAEENVVCESAVEVKSEEVDSTLHTVDLSEEGDSAPEPAEVTPKREERKAQRPSLMAFLRQMSVKGDGGTTHSEEINGKDSSYQTPEAPEKAVAPPEPEPAAAAQKGKDGPSKDKKAAAEPSKQRNGKQEAQEPAPSAAPAAAEASSLQNGDKSQRRPEKRRQSLGGFFKGLGPKRMSDAQVQTDPVSIGPVGKSK